MNRTPLTAALLLFSLLSACGDYLGDYRIDKIQVVSVVPSNAVDGRQLPSDTVYFRIALSSNASLYAANTGPGLYTEADFCPFWDPDRLIAFGPIASDGEPVEDYKRSKELKRGADQRYHYLIYVATSSPTRKIFFNSNQIPSYDLTTGERDVCVRFYVPGYNITPSRSGYITIPARLLREARPA